MILSFLSTNFGFFSGLITLFSIILMLEFGEDGLFLPKSWDVVRMPELVDEIMLFPSPMPPTIVLDIFNLFDV